MSLIGEHQDVEELLQRALLALDFWLPKVPQNGPQEVADRIAADAELLIYREGDFIQDAEELGWIRLTEHPGAEPWKCDWPGCTNRTPHGHPGLPPETI